MKMLKLGLPCFALLACMQISAEDIDSDQSTWWGSRSKSQTQLEDQQDSTRTSNPRSIQDSRYGYDSSWDRESQEIWALSKDQPSDSREARGDSSRNRQDDSHRDRGEMRSSRDWQDDSRRDHGDRWSRSRDWQDDSRRDHEDRWSRSRDWHDDRDHHMDRSGFRGDRDDRGDMDRRFRDQRGYSSRYYEGRPYRYYYPREGWYGRRYYTDYDGWYPSYYGWYPRYYDGWYGVRRGGYAPQEDYYYQRQYRYRDGMGHGDHYDDRYRSDSRYQRHDDDRYRSDSRYQRHDDDRYRSDSRHQHHGDDRYRSGSQSDFKDRGYRDMDGHSGESRGSSRDQQSPSQDSQARKQYLSREDEYRERQDDYIGYENERIDDENWNDQITNDDTRYQPSQGSWSIARDQGISLDDDLDRQSSERSSRDDY